MTTYPLAHTARRLVARGRGILAADESIRTMSTRLEAEGIVAEPGTRRDYRELLLTGAGLDRLVSGVIWCDETFRQDSVGGRPLREVARERGILPGIKVDTGTVPLPGHPGALVTEGLDGLPARLAEYAAMGAAFAKWRAVLDVRTCTPYVAQANAVALARYAAACQDAGIVPVVEPEVLSDGDHGLAECAVTTRTVLTALFEQLAAAGVDPAGTVLKPAFVTPGRDRNELSPRTVAVVTLDVLRDCVPGDLAGIAFLSGGHPTERVCAYLAELNGLGGVPWPATFSFGRALVTDALQTWAGSPANVTRAQRALLDNCARAAEACAGSRAA